MSTASGAMLWLRCLMAEVESDKSALAARSLRESKARADMSPRERNNRIVHFQDVSSIPAGASSLRPGARLAQAALLSRPPHSRKNKPGHAPENFYACR